MASFLEEATTNALPSIYNLHSDVYHDLHPREVRLVKLLKGRSSDKIHCQLHHVCLANRPSYKALSYAWGSPRATRPILVNGYQHAVTVNLESALRRLRKIDEDLTLWIDAICINQSNNAERTEQVNLMHDIFASTEEVIVYLGEVPQHGSMNSDLPRFQSTIAFQYDQNDEEKLELFRAHCTAKTPSKTLKKKARVDFAFDIFCLLRLLSGETDSSTFPAFDPTSRRIIDTKYQRNLFEGLRQMMLSRWWNRIWVIQEIVVPKKIVMVYGSASAPWEMFVSAAHWESRNHSSPAPLLFPHEYSTVLTWVSRIILDVDRMREIWRDGKETALLPLLRRFSGRKASDDRDKVYALLSLARSQTSIVPNYSLNVPEVFQATVLDIIQRTKSLTVLAGDLGRKDRQDLPSWVPDWSASYDDLDRRRADNMGHYNATDGCEVYVQDGEAKEWSGIHRYLDTLTDEQGNHLDITARLSRPGSSHDSLLDRISGMEGWTDWLRNDEREEKPNEETCLAAISNFMNATGRAVCLQNHGGGIIELSGLYQDRVAAIGETAFSDEMLLPVIDSWAILAHNHFLQGLHDLSTSGLGDAFRRTLCADTVRDGSHGKAISIRQMFTNDHGLIAHWVLEGLDLRIGSVQGKERRTAWQALFKDLKSRSPPYLISSNINSAIRSATARRTFFITQKGRIGLGPARTKVGDEVFILLGSQTPFILRDAGVREVFRMPSQPLLGRISPQCYEVVGDCYIHGLMNGEAMEEWKSISREVVDEISTQGLVNQWLRYFEQRGNLRGQLRRWRDETVLSKSRMTERGGYDNTALDKLFEGRLELDWIAKDREQAESYASSLAVWKHQFGLMKDIRWMAELIGAAELKKKQLDEGIGEAGSKMDKIAEQLRQHKTAQRGRVYLV